MHAVTGPLLARVLLVGLPRACLSLASSRGAPDPRCSHFTVANIHINSEGAKRWSVCIVLLLVTRDLCFKLGAVVLTGDFNRAVERVTVSGDSGDRRILTLEDAFSYACVPWPTSGGQQVARVLRSRRVLESQNQWLIIRHGSFDVPSANGLKPTDQPWHDEQWLHLNFARRKRRRAASPADSNSRASQTDSFLQSMCDQRHTQG